MKPKEGKESKDTKETGKEFVKEKEIRTEKVADTKLREVIGTGVITPIRTAPDAATAGTGQPFIQAAERPVLDGSVASAPEPERGCANAGCGRADCASAGCEKAARQEAGCEKAKSLRKSRLRRRRLRKSRPPRKLRPARVRVGAQRTAASRC